MRRGVRRWKELVAAEISIMIAVQYDRRLVRELRFNVDSTLESHEASPFQLVQELLPFQENRPRSCTSCAAKPQ